MRTKRIRRVVVYATESGHLVGFTSIKAEDEYRAEIERGEAEPLIEWSRRESRCPERIEFLAKEGMLY